jgi:hypothetical protein
MQQGRTNSGFDIHVLTSWLLPFLARLKGRLIAGGSNRPAPWGMKSAMGFLDLTYICHGGGNYDAIGPGPTDWQPISGKQTAGQNGVSAGFCND